MRSGVRFFCFGLAAVTALGASAELLRFTPQDTTTANGQYGWNSAKNWLTASGANELPVEGDDLLIDAPADNFHAANHGAYVQSIRFTQNALPYTGVSWNGFCLKSGGSGLKVEHTDGKTCYATLSLDGDVTIDLAGNQTWDAVKGRSATQKGRLTKIGAANLKFPVVGDNWTGATIREGTLTLGKTDAVIDKTGIDFHFDGSAASAWLMLSGDVNLVDGALTSSTDLPKTGHGVKASTARSLSITGTPKVQDMYFAGVLSGPLSFTFAPSVDGSSFTLAHTESRMSGSLTVSWGTLGLAEGATLFVQGAAALTDGGTLSLAADTFLNVETMTVSGTEIEPGIYTSSAASDAGAGITGVDWITGTGLLRVGTPAEPETVAEAVWTHTGSESGAVSVSSNWQTGETPVLGGAQTKVIVDPNATDTVRMALDQSVWIRGLEASAAQDVMVSASGSSMLQTGSAGIRGPSGKTLTLDAPMMPMASQTWKVRGEMGALNVNGAIQSFPDIGLTICGEGGNVAFNAACSALRGPLVVSNVQATVSADGALGPLGASPAFFYHYTSAKTPKFTDGTVVDRDLWLVDTSKAENGLSKLMIPADATVTFNGFVSATNKSDLSIDVGAGARVTFNQLFKSCDECTLSGSGTVVFNGRFYCQDRFYMGAYKGVVEFHAAPDQKNRLYGNYGAFAGGRIKTMVENTLNNANMNAKDSAVLDLCGHSQTVSEMALHAGGGTVTSETPATLRIVRSDGYWANHNYAFGCGYSPPSGYSSDNFYGYECVDRGKWTGAVTLSYEPQNTAMTRFVARMSSSTGRVEIASGRIVFLRRAATAGETFDLKLGSANPCPRETSYDGGWTNATALVVKGGMVELEHSNAIGRDTNVLFEQKNGAYGKLQLDEGVAQKCYDLYIDGVCQARGTWGATGSGAQHIDDVRFAGTGVLNVLSDGRGMVFIVR